MPPTRAASALQFLARAGHCLSGSLDYERTLTAVAGMALPYLGSWCIVDVLEADGSMRRLCIVHPDPARQEHADRLKGGWPPGRDDPLGLPRAVRTRVSEVIPDVSDEMLVALALSEENLRDLRALGIGSVMVVPLVARDHVLGAITFVSSSAECRHAPDDLELAEELASRCAMALDNARLFTDTIRAREEADQVRAEAVRMNEMLVLASIRQQELADEARDANQAKSRFLATMSHEIRTPINAIVGYADLLTLEVAGPVTEGQRHYIDRLLASSQHLIGLIDDILDLAKVEAGRMYLAEETLRSDGTIQSAIDLIVPQAKVAGIDVSGPDPLQRHYLVGDGARVRQILVILLSNALKFTGRGGSVTVECGTSAETPPGTHLDGDGPWAYLAVRDTGIGISEAEAARVFEPFVQVDSGNTRRQGGSGLGLAIALELAHRMGGDLTLRSTGGQGSTFTLWLRAGTPPETLSLTA